MKLYIIPGACSLAVHIVLEELGFDYECHVVDRATGMIEDGTDYAGINPGGYVPALVLDDGQVLTEGPVINQYLADLKPEFNLLPPVGSVERLQVQMRLGFISTELHKTFSPIFQGAPEEWRLKMVQKLEKRFAQVEWILFEQRWLVGDSLTIADIYLFVTLAWGRKLQLSCIDTPALNRYFELIRSRGAVQRAMKAEGLLG